MSTTDEHQERHVPHPDTPTFEQIVAGLRTATVALDPDGQRHALSLLRTLARDGAPVSPALLAAETGQTPGEAAAFIDRLPGVYRDEDGNVVGFWGLAIADFPPHEYRVGGRDLFTWCAWDPFILTDWLGGSAEVSSVDAHTGGQVSFRIEDGSVRDLSHPGLVLSFKLVDEWSADVIASFCHFIHYFTDQDSARPWIDRHPDTFVLSLSDAIELGRIWGQQVFPDLHPTP